MSSIGPSETIELVPIEDTSLLAFYRDMNLPERRTFWACASGWALDGMDFQIYPLVIGTIIAMWKVDPGTAGLAGTVTLLASAVGGWLGGYLADRIGRVRTLQLTILWFSFFSLLCAFVQNFDQLLIARALLGLGFGGEWAAGAVLMGETIRPQYRGRAVGTVQSGWAVGWGIAVLTQAILFSYFPPEIAWRWMFAIGALPALLVFFLIFSLGAIAVILLYTQLPLTNEVLWLLGFPLGFFASGYFSGVGAFLTELYPTRLRGSGQGFCYNFGRGIGALFPFLVGALSNYTSLANAIAIFAVLAYGVFFLAAFALPETRGRILHADA